MNASGTSPPENATASMAQDLLTFPLRAFYKVESFAFFTLPKNIIRLSGLEDMAARAWGADFFADDIVASQRATAAGAGAASAGAAGDAGDAMTGSAAVGDGGVHLGDVFDTLRKLGGFFSYIASRWSYACFVVVRFFFSKTISTMD